ncbi:MAG: chemotaxis protein CheW [Sulfobacillus sp.]|nr:chemotaxis protein CheW [Sulfobacillus sp.]
MNEQLLAVRVGPYLFGAPVSSVTEILAKPSVTRIPRTPSVIAGVAVVRGQPLAVLTLRPALDLPPDDVTLALRWGGHRGAALVAVDQVESLWNPANPLPPELWQGLVPTHVAGWIPRAYRTGDEWLWEWAEDLPDRLQDMAVAHATGA